MLPCILLLGKQILILVLYFLIALKTHFFYPICFLSPILSHLFLNIIYLFKFSLASIFDSLYTYNTKNIINIAFMCQSFFPKNYAL